MAPLLALAPECTLALDKRYPDWPCRQLKVPELSAAAVWPDAMPEGASGEAGSTSELSDLVSRLAARRTPVEEAEKLIAAYVTGTPAEKQAKANALFAHLLDALNVQRSSVMSGLERSYRKQKQLAEIIRANTIKIRELQDAGAEEAKLQELGSQIEWDTRIFEDRRRTTSFACEVPAEIEQRLFALTKLIRKALA
jgi:hypothetical protein